MNRVRLDFRRQALKLALMAVVFGLGGCSAMPSGLSPASWFSSSGPNRNGPPIPGADQPYPSVKQIPDRPDVMSARARALEARGLVADRAHAEYTTPAPGASAASETRAESDLLAPVKKPPTPPRQDAVPPPTAAAGDGSAQAMPSYPPLKAEPLPPPPPAPAVLGPVGGKAAPAPASGAAKAAPAKKAAPTRKGAPPAPAPQDQPPPPPRLPAAPPLPPPLPPPSPVAEPRVMGAPAPSQGAFSATDAALDAGETMVVSGEGVSFENGPSAPAAPPFRAAGGFVRPAMAHGAVAVIYFRPHSARLTARDRHILREVALIERRHHLLLRVVGHADDSLARGHGPQPLLADFDLSIRRARSVASVLRRYGVPAKVVRVEGAATPPAGTGAIEQAFGRRAEILID